MKAIPELLALARHPKSDAQHEHDAQYAAAKTDADIEALLILKLPPFVAAMERALAEDLFADELQKALPAGTLTARNANSRTPLPAHAAGRQLAEAVVSVREFTEWADGFGISVVMEAVQEKDLEASDAEGGKTWTTGRLEKLRAFREGHSMKKTVVEFGISEQRIRVLLSSEKLQANPFAGLTNSTK